MYHKNYIDIRLNYCLNSINLNINSVHTTFEIKLKETNLMN